MTCRIDGCERAVQHAGMCWKHYQRIRRYGTPEGNPSGHPSVRRRQQTHCKHGHEFTPENTYVRPNGCRSCKQCLRNRNVIYRQRERQADRDWFAANGTTHYRHHAAD